jgi:hypothetical protein
VYTAEKKTSTQADATENRASIPWEYSKQYNHHFSGSSRKCGFQITVHSRQYSLYTRGYSRQHNGLCCSQTIQFLSQGTQQTIQSLNQRIQQAGSLHPGYKRNNTASLLWNTASNAAFANGYSIQYSMASTPRIQQTIRPLHRRASRP